MLTGTENHGDIEEILSDSTEFDSEFDIIAELKDTLDGLNEDGEKTDAESQREKVCYLGFLIKELEDTLSGDYEQLRYKRFIIKKTPA